MATTYLSPRLHPRSSERCGGILGYYSHWWNSANTRDGSATPQQIFINFLTLNDLNRPASKNLRRKGELHEKLTWKSRHTRARQFWFALARCARYQRHKPIQGSHGSITQRHLKRKMGSVKIFLSGEINPHYVRRQLRTQSWCLSFELSTKPNKKCS